MTDFSLLHAIGALQVIQRSTSGYGPPSRDPMSRRATRAPRHPRRGVRAALKGERR
jgi:hypothetical protein